MVLESAHSPLTEDDPCLALARNPVLSKTNNGSIVRMQIFASSGGIPILGARGELGGARGSSEELG